MKNSSIIPEFDASAIERQFIVAQQQLASIGLNGSSGHITELRSQALEHFSQSGFPHTKAEDWKYTPVRKWLRDTFVFTQDRPPSTGSLSPFLSAIDAYVVVCRNGVLDLDLSRLPNGEPEKTVSVQSLKDALINDSFAISRHLRRINPGAETTFTSLNLAFLDRGLCIRIPDGVILDKPLYITDLVSGPGIPSEPDTESALSTVSTSGTVSSSGTTASSVFHQTRLLILAGKHSQASVSEIRGPGGHTDIFENTVVQVYASESSHIDYNHVYDRGVSARIIRTLNVYQERNSSFSTNEVILNGSLVRSNLSFLPDGEGCETHLNGFYIAGENMHVDIHTLVDHAQPNCESNEFFKGILRGNATGVFNGRVLVRQDAQKINAYQSNKNVILTDRAHMYSKPELEIYADDVKCSHGATSGQLDKEGLFYLRSRGIRTADAERMLLEAFAADVLGLIKNSELRRHLKGRIAEVLSESTEGLS